MITTVDGPVVIPLQEGRRERRLAAGLLLLLPLAVAASAFFHPVAWWGWLSAAIWVAGTAYYVLRRPAVESCWLEGEEFVLDGSSGQRRIAARKVARVVSFNDQEFPVLVLEDGRTLPLSAKPLWRGTAYPTARVLAEWVKQLGGGSGQLVDPRIQRMSWRPAVGLMLGMAILLSCCLSAIANHPTPRIAQSLGYFTGFVLVRVLQARREPTITNDWTGTPRPW